MTPISELGLSVRTYNALKRAGIDTVEDLKRMINTGYIKYVRGIGTKILEEIEEKMKCSN